MIGRLKKRLRQFVSASDRELVAQAKEGNGTSFGKLYMKYLDPIYRYFFFRLNRNSEQAEDLAEVAFFKAWQNIKNFQDRGENFRAWLYTIARNALVDHYRSKKKFDPLFESVADQKPNPQERLEAKDEEEYLYKAIDKLNDKQKQLVILKFIEGLPNKELAVILNKNEEAIRAMQYRAIRQLRQLLKRIYERKT